MLGIEVSLLIQIYPIFYLLTQILYSKAHLPEIKMQTDKSHCRRILWSEDQSMGQGIDNRSHHICIESKDSELSWSILLWWFIHCTLGISLYFVVCIFKKIPFILLFFTELKKHQFFYRYYSPINKDIYCHLRVSKGILSITSY